jgi:hypothetical protein
LLSLDYKLVQSTDAMQHFYITSPVSEKSLPPGEMMDFRFREICGLTVLFFYLLVSFHADHREAYFAGIFFFGLHEPGSGYAGWF